MHNNNSIKLLLTNPLKLDRNVTCFTLSHSLHQLMTSKLLLSGFGASYVDSITSLTSNCRFLPPLFFHAHTLIKPEECHQQGSRWVKVFNSRCLLQREVSLVFMTFVYRNLQNNRCHSTILGVAIASLLKCLCSTTTDFC